MIFCQGCGTDANDEAKFCSKCGNSLDNKISDNVVNKSEINSASDTGTKYLTISAASGDKIKIVLGAGTKQLDKRDGETKTRRANIGGSERIFNVANSAMNNIRQAIREKAN